MFAIVMLVQYFFEIKNPITVAIILGALAIIVTPRIKKIKTQSGEKTQFTWVFLKKTFFLE